MTNGKVALVTGASRGIGRACAIKLGEAGYKVADNYNSNEAAANEVVEKIKAAGSEAVAIKANVSDLAEVKTMMREVINTFGQLDVLVNNAGIVKDEFVLMMNPDTIDQCLDLNIKGYMYCTQQAVLEETGRDRECIIRKFQACSTGTECIQRNERRCELHDSHDGKGTCTIWNPRQCSGTGLYRNRYGRGIAGR